MEELPLEKTEKKRWSWKRLLRIVIYCCAGLALCWVGLVIILSALYWFAPPVSTLMIGDYLAGNRVKRVYVSMDSISPHLTRAVISAEDASFCAHSGVDWEALGNAIQTTFTSGPNGGASTIPMQMSKNLFLLPIRSYLRKAVEIPLSLYLSAIWSKRRMIEIYLNTVEWGRGIYGAEAAAQHYFKKPAKALTQREAALLAVALPNPIIRNPGNPASFHRTLASQLVERMNAESAVDYCLH